MMVSGSADTDSDYEYATQQQSVKAYIAAQGFADIGLVIALG